jgi:zinc protease
MFAAGDAELDLATDLLSHGKTSRLYRRLVYEDRIATDVSASQSSREVGSFVQMSATAAPGHALPELYDAITEEVAKLAGDGPTDVEIERGRVQAETQFVQRLQTVGGFGGKSDQLNAYNTYLGRPDYFADDLGRYARVTHASLQETVKRYLHDARRVALSIVPNGRLDLAMPESAPVAVS